MAYRFLAIIGGTYLVFVLQTSLASAVSVAGYPPQLVLAALAMVILYRPDRYSLALAAGWGLIEDALADGRLGIGCLCFVCGGYAVQHIAARRPATAWTTFWVTGLFVMGVMVTETGLRGWQSTIDVNLAPAIREAFVSAILSASIAAVIALCVGRTLRAPQHDQTPTGPTVSNRWRMLTH